jgi:predicted nucleic-acid-binding protein
MLGIDTNVLVRLLLRDDAQQHEQASKLIKQELANGRPVLISHLVLLETLWVLQGRYRIDKARQQDVLTALLEADDLRLEDEAAVETALFLWKNGTTGFADCLIGSKNQRLGCSFTATFDAKAAKLPCFIPLGR